MRLKEQQQKINPVIPLPQRRYADKFDLIILSIYVILAS